MTDTPLWLSDDEPLEAERSAAQIRGIVGMANWHSPARVLELGCGAGRIVRPLVEAGHDVTAIDRRADALDACDHLPITFVNADLRDEWPLDDAVFEFVTCVGNTLMTFWDVDDAIALLTRAASRLAPDGTLLIDDMPRDFLPELTSGNWQNGISPDGDMQMVWEENDLVFALRQGDAVDPDVWQIGAGEQRYRLWTEASLTLVARAAGLSDPVPDVDGGLLMLRRQGALDARPIAPPA